MVNKHMSKKEKLILLRAFELQMKEEKKLLSFYTNKEERTPIYKEAIEKQTSIIQYIENLIAELKEDIKRN